MKNPLVSIIIPVYNGSNFMREAIDSALAQTYPNIEILVVNDGSTDDTRAIALSYGDKIRYFEKENGGVATALNLAIREMKGEYFSWLSHDDWYTPDKVEAEIAALRRCGDMTRAAYSACDFVQYPSGSGGKKNGLSFGKNFAETGWFAVAMGLISGCTLLIPKSYFDEFGGFDEQIRAANDYEQWFKMFRDKRLAFVEKSLVGSRVHAKQVTVTYAGMREEEDRVWAWIMKGLQQVDITKSGITLQQVYRMALPRFFAAEGYPRTENVLLEYLRKTEGTEKAADPMQARSQERLMRASGCYVYCAGRFARRLIRSLRWRGLFVRGVADSNPAKWGTMVEGIRCISPSEIPEDAKIIVANACPGEIVAQLRERGFEDVETSDDFAYDLLVTPVKEEYCGVV